MISESDTSRPLLERTQLHRGLVAVRCDPPATVIPRGRILCLHGMNAGAWQFEALQRYFAARGYSSLALNYRGHHGSACDRPLGRVSVEEYVEDALVGVRALGKPIVVGQSIGGLIAQQLAAAGEVSALVALVSLPPRGIVWRGGPALYASWLATVPDVVLGRELRPSRRTLDATIFNLIEPSERAGLYARQVPESSWAGFQVAMGLVAVDAARVTCPVLSVTAEHDALVRPSVGAAIARKYRGALLALPNCGHYALVGERSWEPRAAAIADWLSNVESRL